MLKVFPKIDDEFLGFFNIRKYIRDGIEIQMTTTETTKLMETVDNVIVSVPEIKEITIHSPMCRCDIELNFENQERLKFMYDLIKCASIICKEHGIRVNLLYHCRSSFSEFQDKNQLWLFRRLTKLTKGKRIYMLLENELSFKKTKTGKEPLISTIKMLRSNKVQMCLDLCHMHANLNGLADGTTFKEMYEDANLKRIVRQIHFSATLNNDGFKDMTTHGKVHPTIENLKEDLAILESLNIIDSNIVVEIVEGDYSSREGQIAEIEMINKLYEVL